MYNVLLELTMMIIFEGSLTFILVETKLSVVSPRLKLAIYGLGFLSAKMVIVLTFSKSVLIFTGTTAPFSTSS